MPTRTSSTTTRRRVVAPADSQAQEFKQLRLKVARQSALITILFILVAGFGLGGALVFCQYVDRIAGLEQMQSPAMMSDMQQLNTRLQSAMQDLAALQQHATPAPTTTTTPSVVSPNGLPTSQPTMSPSGQLDRGTVSPDGTKYAGYEDVVKGKMGVAVELLNSTSTRKIKYIVIFNPYSESTGMNLPQGQEMSVRWKDNSTIEYDVLTKKGSAWVKSTNTVKIFF